MRKDMIIESRFCALPGSGNGGYACGGVAEFIDGAAKVTLRLSTPLGTLLSLESTGNTICLFDDDGIIADAHPSEVKVKAPCRPSYDEAEDAMRHYTGFRHHLLPNCFVCGTG
jgi:hypothetical protein